MNVGSKIKNILLKVLKYIWIPVLFCIALIIGAYIGYGVVTKTSGSDVFKLETWEAFFKQISSLRVVK